MKAVNLCKTGCCPKVVMEDCCVRIGEGDNTAVLKPEEWNTLVEKVLTGELGKI